MQVGTRRWHIIGSIQYLTVSQWFFFIFFLFLVPRYHCSNRRIDHRHETFVCRRARLTNRVPWRPCCGAAGVLDPVNKGVVLRQADGAQPVWPIPRVAVSLSIGWLGVTWHGKWTGSQSEAAILRHLRRDTTSSATDAARGFGGLNPA